MTRLGECPQRLGSPHGHPISQAIKFTVCSDYLVDDEGFS